MQKLLLKDYDKIKKYLDDANYEGYNSNFVTMMMWDHEYKKIRIVSFIISII